ncbi:uncharacterized protein YjlB [Sphingobium sp. B2D3A]|uniref:hypothetical protein n=1 Tax=unclassified Sphingobium TaxID=2611147 RepID=UPI00222425AB|nr:MULTISPECIES: hypothetical protein [unclassified Sphingobium]MCW2338851.1 uncharacterized protein YjlB [Sphingobium sp. B2D3A]MCW2385278.1 uncharacterized protein YjlB [Sphingobium sp. B2D3D]
MFDYHHYHSTTHEALGVFAGRAMLELGGPDGRQVEVVVGDAVMLPVGTGHRCVASSEDFQVVGAYPKGLSWDICREGPDDAAKARMAAVPDRRRDPVAGETGAQIGHKKVSRETALLSVRRSASSPSLRSGLRAEVSSRFLRSFRRVE